jgi:hypothetical protein
VLAFKAKKTKLQLALEHCRKRYKHNKRKRLGCERAARKKYGAKKSAKHNARH